MGPEDVTESEPYRKTFKWANRFLDLAHLIASWSKDPSTQVGAVAVGEGRQILATGYNGLPRGIRDNSDRMERPAKYLWTVHAEANLIAHAARHGLNLRGSAVYVTHHPCSQCAALLVQAGVKTVYVDESGKTNMPQDTFDAAKTMFSEARIDVISVHRPKGGNDAQPDNPS
jgi:dCMP deaminase